VTTPARVLSRVAPDLSAGVREAGVGGTVEIEVSIDATGRVVDARPRSGPSGLQGAAIEAVRQWRYTPATVDGIPVASQGSVTLEFGSR
jgi:protein TonB